MTVAVIGAGGIGSAIARQLASGGESLRLASADSKSARTLAAQIGKIAVVAPDNHDASRRADAVVLALQFTVLEVVIGEIADSLTDKLVIVRSKPVTLDAQGAVTRLLTKWQSSGEVVAGGCRLERFWPWRSEPCQPISSNPRATGHRRHRCSSTSALRHSSSDQTGGHWFRLRRWNPRPSRPRRVE